jgi:4-hydroxybenzoate polyprenyltransferase
MPSLANEDFEHFYPLLFSVFLFLLPDSLPFGTIYWIGFAIFTILITYQHLIVKPNDLSRVNLAFFTTNGIASIVFAAFVIADLVFAK